MTQLPLSAQRKKYTVSFTPSWIISPRMFWYFPSWLSCWGESIWGVLAKNLYCTVTPSTSLSPPVVTIHGSSQLWPIWVTGEHSPGYRFHIQSSKTCRHILTATRRDTILWHGTVWARGWGCVPAWTGSWTDLHTSTQAPLAKQLSTKGLRKSLLPTRTCPTTQNTFHQLTRPSGLYHVSIGVSSDMCRCWRSHSLVGRLYPVFFSTGFPSLYLSSMWFPWILLCVRVRVCEYVRVCVRVLLNARPWTFQHLCVCVRMRVCACV